MLNKRKVCSGDENKKNVETKGHVEPYTVKTKDFPTE